MKYQKQLQKWVVLSAAVGLLSGIAFSNPLTAAIYQGLKIFTEEDMEDVMWLSKFGLNDEEIARQKGLTKDEVGYLKDYWENS